MVMLPDPGTEPDEDSDFPPELLAQRDHRMIREIGRGGMGVVYLARNVLMDRLVVFKVLNPEMMANPNAVERFLREIRLAATLKHPHVVSAYNAFHAGELVVLALEYVDGQDLLDVVRARGPLPVVNACYYAHQVALGLQHAHECELVHRDIKPSNIMLEREGNPRSVKILDFGLAKALREERIGEERILGTPEYVAPEQSVNAAAADIRADIYSLGCTLYYLLAGRTPFAGKKNLKELLLAHRNETAVPLDQLRSEVPPALAALVGRLMAKSPDARPRTPAEVAQALLPFITPTATPPAPPTLPIPPPRRPRPIPPPEETFVEPPPPRAERQPRPRRRKRNPFIPWIRGGVLFAILWGLGLYAYSAGKWPFEPEPKPEPPRFGELVIRNVPADNVLFTIDDLTADGTRTGNEVRFGGLAIGEHRVAVFQNNARIGVNSPRVEAGTPAIWTLPTITPPAPPGEKRATVTGGGAWSVRNDELVFSSRSINPAYSTLVFGKPTWDDITLKLEFLMPPAGFLTVRTHESAGRHHSGIGILSSSQEFWYRVVDATGKPQQRSIRRTGKVAANEWHTLIVQSKGPATTVILDNATLFFGAMPTTPTPRERINAAGQVALVVNATDVRFRKIEVSSPDGKPLWRGLPELP